MGKKVPSTLYPRHRHETLDPLPSTKRQTPLDADI